MNGTCTSAASGSQCALEGIGRTGLAGIAPPTSAKIQTKSTSSRPDGDSRMRPVWIIGALPPCLLMTSMSSRS